MPNRRRNTQLAGPSQFSLRLLGAAELHRTASDDSSGRVISLGAKQFALVAFLACAKNRAATRVRLTELFAPDTSDEEEVSPDQRDKRAADATRDLIRQLRSGQKLGRDALGPPGEDPVRLTADLKCDCDAVLAASKEHDHEAVVTLYGGELLPNFENLVGAEFAIWLEAERAALRRRFIQAARQLLSHDYASASDEQTLSKAIVLARRLRDTDEHSETAWRHVLRYLIRVGDHDEAAVEADRFRRAWKDTGAIPDAKTQNLLAIADNVPTRVIAATSAGNDAGARTGVFGALIGRDTEVEEILTAWDRARAGEFVHVRITAAAGLGKTRLLSDIRQRLAVRSIRAGGTQAIEVMAAHGAKDLPYSFLSDLVRALAERPGGLGVPEWVATILVALNPGLSTVYRRATPALSATPPSARNAQLALQELIAALAIEGPVAILLDDLHWADRESVQVLASALEACGKLPLLVVTASRDSSDDQWPLIDATTVRLQPLTQGGIREVTALVSSFPDQQLSSDRLATALWESTGGLPLLVGDALRLLTERSLLVAHQRGWEVRDADGVLAALAKGDATRRRIGQISIEERRLLLLLAVADRPLSLSHLRGAANEAIGPFNAALTSLERRGLAIRRDDSWAIAHEAHAKAIRAEAGDAEWARCSAALGAIVADAAGNDLRDLRYAARLLARGGASRELFSAVQHCVDKSRSQGRVGKRSMLQLVRETLGEDADTALVESCVRELPVSFRYPMLARIRRHALPLTAGLAATVAILVATSKLHPATPPDAVLFAERMAADRSTFELTPIPLDASHWAGIHIIDVPADFRTRWRRRIGGVGGLGLRADGKGWTAGYAVADSGVLDVFDVNFDGSSRRLTFSKSDDFGASWAPDNSAFVFVTSRWTPHGRYDLGVYDTLTRRVRQLTSGDDTDGQAQWSPDGSRIAFIREYYPTGDRGLCVIDVDGSQLRCWKPKRDVALMLVQWSDAHRVFLRRTIDSTHAPGLLRFNLETDETDVVDVRGADAFVSPDGRFAVCQCPRQGYASTPWIVYPIGRPDEFAVLHLVGSTHGAVNFGWAPTTPRPPFIDRLSVSVGNGAPILGTSHQLRVSGVDIAGDTVPAGVIRWHSADTSVASIDSTGLLLPKRSGRVAIEASAGGWRTTRVELAIRQFTSTVLLDEDWSRGIETNWRPFGVPRPIIVTDELLGRAFLNNGDGAFFSGAYTRRAYPTKDGLWIETELSTHVTTGDSQDALVSMFADTDSALYNKWDHITGDGPPGSSPAGWWFRFPFASHDVASHPQYLIVTVHHEVMGDAPVGITGGRVFRLVMQLFPDGRRALSIDGRIVWTELADFIEPEVRSGVGGNSVGTRMLVGHTRILTGIAPEFRQTP